MNNKSETNVLSKINVISNSIPLEIVLYLKARIIHENHVFSCKRYTCVGMHHTSNCAVLERLFPLTLHTSPTSIFIHFNNPNLSKAIYQIFSI